MTATWHRTTPAGILVSASPDVWNTGRVMALMPVGAGRLLAGSSDAGVWLVDAAGATATSVGDWEHAAVRCLARCPDGRYLAGVVGGVYLSSTPDPLGGWEYVYVPGNGPVTVNEIALVDRNGTPCVVAGTSDGALWSPLPSSPAEFTWILTSVTTRVTSIVASSGNRLFAGVDRPFGSGGQILRGVFEGDALQFTEPEFEQSIDRKLFGHIALAVSADHPRHAYALVGNWKTNTLLTILRWHDEAGIGVWVAVTTPSAAELQVAAQFDRNQSIAVGPHDPNRVVFTSGTFEVPWVSVDGGQTWSSAYYAGRHLHADMDSSVFDPEDPTDSRIIVSGDGGIFTSDDFGSTFGFGYNQRLPIHQFYPSFGRSFLAVDRDQPSVIAGALQDNGVVLQGGPGAPWVKVVAGDGGDVTLLPGSRLLHHLNTLTTPRIVTFQVPGGGAAAVLGDIVQPENPRPVAQVLVGGIATVAPPEFRPVVVAVPGPLAVPADRWIAFGAHGPEVYGLVDEAPVPRWQPITTLGPSAQVGGLSVDHAATRLIAGTSDGRILDMGVRAAYPSAFDIVDGRISGEAYPSSTWVTDICADPDSIEGGVYAVARPGLWADGSIIRRVDRAHWEVASSQMPDGRRVKGLAVDHAGAVIYAMTLTGIWFSWDDAGTWARLTDPGLPRSINYSQITFIRSAAEGAALYLSTWGNGAWRLAR